MENKKIVLEEMISKIKSPHSFRILGNSQSDIRKTYCRPSNPNQPKETHYLRNLTLTGASLAVAVDGYYLLKDHIPQIVDYVSSALFSS